MSTQAVWHGTPDEAAALARAVANNCACQFGLMAVRITTCEPHRMFLEDQRALDGLLFARRMANYLRRQEFSPRASGY